MFPKTLPKDLLNRCYDIWYFCWRYGFSYVFRSLGGDDLIHEFVNEMGFGPWGILFVMMGLVFLLGFFFDWVEIT